MTRRNPYNRPPLQVEHDADGGLTVRDPQSQLVVSIVSTHPAASGPRGIIVEVYDYNGGPVPWQDATQRRVEDDGITRPDPKHPTVTFYAQREDDR